MTLTPDVLLTIEIEPEIVQTVEIGFEGPTGALAPEDRERVDAAVAAADALAGAIEAVTAARRAAEAAARDAVAGATQGASEAVAAAVRAVDAAAAEAARLVGQITGLSVVSGDKTAYDPLTGRLTIQRGERGPRPTHEWSGTSLAVQNPDGTMGTAVDLRGRDGTSAAVRVATATTAAALSAQYPTDLIVVPQA